MAILKNIPSPADSQAVELGADVLNEDPVPMSSCIIEWSKLRAKYLQHRNPKAITQALMAMAHENVSPKSALEFLNHETR